MWMTVLPVTARLAPPLPTGSGGRLPPASCPKTTSPPSAVHSSAGSGRQVVLPRRRAHEAVVIGRVDRDRRPGGDVERTDDLHALLGVRGADRDPDLHRQHVEIGLQEPDGVAEGREVGRQLDVRGAGRRPQLLARHDLGRGGVAPVGDDRRRRVERDRLVAVERVVASTGTRSVWWRPARARRGRAAAGRSAVR